MMGGSHHQQHHRGGRGGSDRGRHSHHRRPLANRSGIFFRSLQEEQDWVQERRSQRLARPSKFDLPMEDMDETDSLILRPNAAVAPGTAASPPTAAVVGNSGSYRKLFVGNVPEDWTPVLVQQEIQAAIQKCRTSSSQEDPVILRVIKNLNEKYAFVEFVSPDWATAALQLDGMTPQPNMLWTFRRPSDYPGTKVDPEVYRLLDVSKINLISQIVVDGPNKLKISGLPPTLTREQVLELLQAFGPVRSFTLEMESTGNKQSRLSKGYGFCEYNDPLNTEIALQGLNGMEVGSDYRLRVERSTKVSSNGDAPRTIIQGYDIETLVDVALGQAAPPVEVMFRDPYGLPLTRIVN